MYNGMSLTKMVKNKKVIFEYYQNEKLWYSTEDGFMFPVPIEDTDRGRFLKEDKATLFMRYIRKELESYKVEKENGKEIEGNNTEVSN